MTPEQEKLQLINILREAYLDLSTWEMVGKYQRADTRCNNCSDWRPPADAIEHTRKLRAKIMSVLQVQ